MKIKVMAIMTMVLILSACSSTPPKQTQPSGALSPIFETQNELNERN